MKRDWVLTQEAFDALLDWLDSNREGAAQKYETIRIRLIKIFACRGCVEAEDLADETMNRVTSKLAEIQATFTGEPARYFFGVANKVHLEYLRRKPTPPSPQPAIEGEELEREHQCLDRCMATLSTENSNLLLSYYQGDKHAKIEHRKQLAMSMGIAANALRIRVCRIRAAVEVCVKQCLEEVAA